MSSQLLIAYIRTVVEGHMARVPNQLVSDDRLNGSGNETEDEESDGEMDEFAGVGGGGISGFTAPLGIDPNKLGRKKNKPQRK